MTRTHENLTDAILELLTSPYRLESGEIICGQSLSFTHSELRARGWKGLGHLNDFESTVQRLGFRMTRGQLIRFGKARTPARVITL